jgi:hypothetical protein
MICSKKATNLRDCKTLFAEIGRRAQVTEGTTMNTARCWPRMFALAAIAGIMFFVTSCRRSGQSGLHWHWLRAASRRACPGGVHTRRGQAPPLATPRQTALMRPVQQVAHGVHVAIVAVVPAAPAAVVRRVMGELNLGLEELHERHLQGL